MRADVKPDAPLLYISDQTAGTVTIYPQRGHQQVPFGQITHLDSPTGLAVDRAGNLWVYKNGPSPKILGFHLGLTMPFVKLRAAGGMGLAVDNDGNIYASTPSNVIDIYAPGSLKPTSSVTVRNISQVWYIAVDDRHNIFCNGIQYVTSAPARYPVDEIVHTSGKQRNLIYDLELSAGLAIGGSRQLLVQDALFKNISVYPPPYRNQQPLSVVTYKYYSYDFALTKDGGDVWVPQGEPRGTIQQQYAISTGLRKNETAAAPMSREVFGVATYPARF